MDEATVAWVATLFSRSAVAAAVMSTVPPSGATEGAVYVMGTPFGQPGALVAMTAGTGGT